MHYAVGVDSGKVYLKNESSIAIRRLLIEKFPYVPTKMGQKIQNSLPEPIKIIKR